MRKWREKRGISQQALGRRIRVSQAQVSLLEQGLRSITQEVARRIDEALDTGGAVEEHWLLNGNRAYRGNAPWFRQVVEIEQQAIFLRMFEPLLVPGLLQTEAYARELIKNGEPHISDATIEDRVQARLERQNLLLREDCPRIWVILDLAVLKRPIGGPEVMREQLDHMLRLGENPRFTVQLLPEETPAHPGLTGGFLLASFDRSPDVVYLETVVAGSTVTVEEEVRKILDLFQHLQTEAHPRGQSLAYIERIGNVWK